jgi:hypothetical protein
LAAKKLFDPLPPIGDEVLVEARYWAKLDGEVVQCRLCFRKCTIPEGARGYSQVRENRRGTLYTLVYGKTYPWQVAPLEKDGMYHLLPGSKLLALATAFCNFRCQHRQFLRHLLLKLEYRDNAKISY